MGANLLKPSQSSQYLFIIALLRRKIYVNVGLKYMISPKGRIRRQFF